MISFNKPLFFDDTFEFIEDAINRGKISGDGFYTKECERILSANLASNVLLTSSCTHALEMIALIEDWGSDTEIIVPGYTFVSSALAFSKFRCRISFCDVDANTGMSKLEHYKKAYTSDTKAVVLVHYGGKMAKDTFIIKEWCDDMGIILIEDAAQAIDVTLNGIFAGSVGDYGAFSFHETKNITSAGEGGALIVKDSARYDLAFQVRDKGTNRRAFFQGMVDKYGWKTRGSSYIMSEVSAAYLYSQLLKLDQITEKRRRLYLQYYNGLLSLKEQGKIYYNELFEGNGHMFYILSESRQELLSYLRSKGIEATFHYLTLSDSKFVEEHPSMFTRIAGNTLLGSRKIENEIIRLPIHNNIKEEEMQFILTEIKKYYE